MRYIRLRWIIAAIIICMDCRLFMRLESGALGNAGSVETWATVLICVPSMILSVLLIFPDTGLKLVHWLGDIASGIFFPRATEAKPPLSYRLAHYYVADGLFEKAAGEYQRILHYYPEERTAYQELIEVALRLNNQGMVEKWRTAYRHQFHEQPFPVGPIA